MYRNVYQRVILVLQLVLNKQPSEGTVDEGDSKDIFVTIEWKCLVLGGVEVLILVTISVWWFGT